MLNRQQMAKLLSIGVSTLDLCISQDRDIPRYIKIGNAKNSLCVRSEFLTSKKAIVRYEHNAREDKHASKIGYLRGNSHNNKYIVLSEYNDNGNMREIPSSDKEFNNKKYIKNSCWNITKR
ncbi:MAG: hypothetical protein ACTTJS_07520 [Wolinella sp.]